MVGVPGRSKGCATCRKRKKKCDLQRPACGNCVRAKYDCSGYERDMIVVQVDDASGRGTYKPPNRTDTPTRLKSFDSNLILAKSNSQSPASSISPVDVRLKDLNRTALENEYFNAFWDLYLPKTVWISGHEWPPMSGGSSMRWAEYTNHYAPVSEVLRIALLALSTSKVGRAKQDQALKRRGIELYGQALTLLGKELRRPAGRKHFGVLNGCRLLALYEQLNDVGASALNWRGHINGMMNLIQLHPPELFANPPKLVLFREARYSAIVLALHEDKSTFLSSPDWLTKPWANRPKGPVDSALDVLCKLTNVLEEWVYIDANMGKPEMRPRAEALKATVWALQEELSVWYDNFVSGLEPHLDPYDLAILLDGKDNPSKQAQYPDLLIKYGLPTLHAMTIYWSGLIMVHSKLNLVYRNFPSASAEVAARLRAPNFNIVKTCICIARSSRFFLEPNLGLATTLYFAPAATFTARALRLCRRAISKAQVEEVEEVEELDKLLQEARNMDSFMWTGEWKDGMDRLRASHQDI